MQLYDRMIGIFCDYCRFSEGITSIRGVKWVCVLSSRLVGIYIDYQQFIREFTQSQDGCLLHQILVSFLLFVDVVV